MRHDCYFSSDFYFPVSKRIIIYAYYFFTRLAGASLPQHFIGFHHLSNLLHRYKRQLYSLCQNKAFLGDLEGGFI